MRYLSLVAASFLLSGCVIGDFGPSDQFQEDFHYSWDLQPGGRVMVETFNGRVEISGWDDNKVDVSGTKYGSSEHLRDAVKIETHNSDSLIEVRAIRPSTSTGNSGARLTIHVPKSAVIERVTSSNGAIQLSRVSSVTHLKTSNGAIRVADASGDLDARTSNGQIELERFTGNVALRSSNGRIRAEALTGKVDAETSNSSINVRLANSPAAPIRLVSSNGAIDLAMDNAPQNDIRAETRNGSITLRLPANTAAHINADTSNSNISSEFEVLAKVRDDRERKDHLNGAIGNGGPTIDLSTRNGHIRLVKGSGI